MAKELGVIEESAATLKQLVFEDVKYQSRLIDVLVPCVVGQVVQWNSTSNVWDAYTSAHGADAYAVIAEDKTLSGDTQVSCVVSGSVRKSKLDATAQADAEIEIALSKSGIFAVADNIRTT